MKHKSVFALSSFLLLSSFIPTFSFPCNPSSSKSNKIRQRIGSPIEGFTLETQFNNKVFDEKDGYCYMEAYIYSTKATSHSSFVLVETLTSFTPGYVAYQNDHFEYNNDSYLKGGYLHIDFARFYCNDAHGDLVTLKRSFPMTEAVSSTIETSYGASISLGSSIDNQISLSDNSSVSLKRGLSGGLSFSYTKTTSTTSSDPHISYQFGKDSAYQEWSFSVINQSIAGSSTFWFHALNLLEVKNEDIDSVPDNSFEMNYSVKMITTTNSITRNSQFQYC